MAARLIALNHRRTREQNRAFVTECPLTEYDTLTRSTELQQLVNRINNTTDDEQQRQLKSALPFRCAHYTRFRDNHRDREHICPESFTWQTCVDIDDPELVERANTMSEKLDIQAGGEWQCMMLHKDYSARRKLHIDIRLPIGMTVPEAQRAYCRALGVEADTSCFTPERFIYITPADYEIYRDDGWYEQLSDEEIAIRRKAYTDRGLTIDGRTADGNYFDEELGTNFANLRELINNATEDKNKIRDNSCNSCQKNIDERVRFVMEAVLKAKNLDKSDFTDIGGRHNAVKIFLSGANQLLSKEEANRALAELMPEHWADENIQACVADFYDKYYNPTQKLTKDQEGIFTQSRRLKENESPQPTLELDSNTPMHELTKLFASETPPAIPKDVPKLVKAVTCNTPDKYKATVAQAMFPGLMAYPKKLNFVYIDNQVRELRANCLIVAGTGTGKDSCTKQPLTRIIADMKARDEENRKRLKEFNDEFNSKASNKQKPQRPADLIIQTIKSDITKAALVQRMDEAQGAPLYVRINELEQWDKIEGSTGRGNQFTTLKLCDDEGNDYGTDRAGTQSVMGSGSLHLNWNANTTTAKAIKYFRYVLTDGPISRLCLATIPEEEIGAEISVFGTYDEKYDAALKPYIENLKQATGTIDCKEARKLARKLKDECADFARLSQDRVFDNLSHRALVIAFRKACLLYAANGMKWEKSIETFCRWSLFYDLYIKMTVFGDLIRHADDDIQTSRHGPQNLLVFLPVEFTLDDAKRVRQQQGLSTDDRHTKRMIRNWIRRDFVTQNSELSFKKALITEGKK